MVRLLSEILHNNQQIQTTSFLPHPKLIICSCIDQIKSKSVWILWRLMKSFLSHRVFSKAVRGLLRHDKKTSRGAAIVIRPKWTVKMFRSRISVFKHLVLLSEFTVNLLQSRKCMGGSQIRESHLVMFSDTLQLIWLIYLEKNLCLQFWELQK